jgi:hypothetical protein
LKKQVFPRFCKPGVNVLALGEVVVIVLAAVAVPFVLLELVTEAACNNRRVKFVSKNIGF